MASRSTIFSLSFILLSARSAIATTHSVEDLTFMAYEESYGYQTDTSSSPETALPSSTTPDGGYGYQMETESTSILSSTTSEGYGYQTSTPAESSLPIISTPAALYPTAPSYSSSSSSQTCTNSTTIVTIPYSTPTPSTSHTCNNTTITSTIYPSISTPSISPSSNCSKSTTTVTIPWPGTGTGYAPSGTGYAGGNGGWNGTTTYYAPTLGTGTSPPSYPTPVPPVNSTSNFELPETSSAVEYGGDTPTSTPTPEAEPSDTAPAAPPAPPASSTGPDEPLFSGGAARYGSGASLAVAVGAMVAWL
ncbi:uncharacterized protein N0V89_003211 [Didymosphaeria variabile]|uniref:Uncharacterized protein n=1 Tax=Didymosphaeria variabile TaxID=1932322 RepID=A0A9W9CF47_9PLEO|nr:uncharacterized protein N0V89_003211 [Didymosphaeria variabile]KAJ4358627.1 hypothetical protein N0V89_003211 [Didymosphaeria variabile]